jgi:hypothetical protein
MTTIKKLKCKSIDKKAHIDSPEKTYEKRRLNFLSYQGRIKKHNKTIKHPSPIRENFSLLVHAVSRFKAITGRV